MRLILLVFVFITISSCSTFKPNYIDWKNAPENPNPFGPFEITTNHFNLKGDVKSVYRVSYIKKDSTYISSLLLLAKFDKNGKLLSSRKGLFYNLGKEETTYHYTDNMESSYSLRSAGDRVFRQDFFYNKRGELILRKSGSSETTFRYDKNGNLIQKLKNGNVNWGPKYLYDKRDRLIAKTYFKRDGTKRDEVKYTYKKRGENLVVDLTSYSKKHGIKNYTHIYDKHGYRVDGLNEEGKVKNTIIRDQKGNVIEDICGTSKKYYVITYWDGTTSGYDPKLDEINN